MKWQRDLNEMGAQTLLCGSMCHAAMDEFSLRAMSGLGKGRDGAVVCESELELLNPLLIGGIMEDMVEALRLANDEARKSKEALQALKNDVSALGDVIGPLLVDQIKSLRDQRMAVVGEINQMLTMLRDIRAFFLEKDYRDEIQRMHEFIGLAERLRQLHADGTLSAITDVVIGLALKQQGDAHAKPTADR